jgi:hypothetical protein
MDKKNWPEKSYPDLITTAEMTKCTNNQLSYIISALSSYFP